jgi:hypothetical protein
MNSFEVEEPPEALPKQELTREEELNQALLDLDVTRDDVESASKVSVPLSNDRLFDCQNIAKEYKATMEGKSRKETEQKGDQGYSYVQTSRALASTKYINLTYSLLYSFADTSNISSNKKFEQFFIQLRDAFNKARDMGLRDKSIRDTEFSAIITLFKQKLVNIGQIITNEQGNMKLLLERVRRSEEFSDVDIDRISENTGDARGAI